MFGQQLTEAVASNLPCSLSYKQTTIQDQNGPKPEKALGSYLTGREVVFNLIEVVLNLIQVILNLIEVVFNLIQVVFNSIKVVCNMIRVVFYLIQVVSNF